MPVVDVYDISRNKVGEANLRDDIFNIPVQGHILHEVVTMQLACRRSGHSLYQGTFRSERRWAQTLAPERDRSRPSRVESLPSVARRRCRLRTQAPELRLQGTQKSTSPGIENGSFQ